MDGTIQVDGYQMMKNVAGFESRLMKTVLLSQSCFVSSFIILLLLVLLLDSLFVDEFHLRSLDFCDKGDHFLNQTFPCEVLLMGDTLTILDIFRNPVYNVGDANHAFLTMLPALRKCIICY
jgi:hypothetical protein